MVDKSIFGTTEILNKVFKIYFKHPKTYNELHLIVEKTIELTTQRIKAEVEKLLEGDLVSIIQFINEIPRDKTGLYVPAWELTDFIENKIVEQKKRLFG